MSVTCARRQPCLTFPDEENLERENLADSLVQPKWSEVDLRHPEHFVSNFLILLAVDKEGLAFEIFPGAEDYHSTIIADAKLANC